MDDGWEAAHSTDFQKISRNFEQSSANGPTPSRILPGSQAIRSNPSERKTALNNCLLRAKQTGCSGVGTVRASTESRSSYLGVHRSGGNRQPKVKSRLDEAAFERTA